MPSKLELSFPPSEAPPAIDDEEALRSLAAKRMRIAPDALSAVRATRVSFDARRKHRAWRVALTVWERDEEAPPVVATTPPTFDPPTAAASHVAIVGSGPAGLYAALDLLAAGLRVTVFERGRDVRTRRRPIRSILRGGEVDPDCNYCFGEGGAGTYSDGKLYTRSGNKRRVREILETLVAHGAPPEILVSWRPHVGSNRLPEVVTAIRETILRSGGAVRFGARVEEIETTTDGAGRRVVGVTVRDLDREEVSTVPADACILATGHSALDSVLMARRAGALLVPKGFAMGVRIEHPQDWLDQRQYGGLRGECDLPASFYELTTQVDERGVYSFCMCPGGFVVPSTTSSDRVVLNGMSLSRRDSPYANSGLVVAIEPEDWTAALAERWGWSAVGIGSAPKRAEDEPLFGIELQLALEKAAARAGGGKNRAPAQRADRFAGGRDGSGEARATSFRPGVTPVDLHRVLPRGLGERIRLALIEFDRKLPGYASDRGQLLGVETRTSSPVRIERDRETLESPDVTGLYPCGEGAGYAGGIVSAALDGRRAAAAVAEKFVTQ